METLLYFLLFAGLFAVMMRFGCGAHVMGHGHHSRSRPGGTARPPGGDNLRGSAAGTAVDPVCGMTVKTAEARTALHQGRAYYFCSPICRDKFEASPATYATGAAITPEPMDQRHGVVH